MRLAFFAVALILQRVGAYANSRFCVLSMSASVYSGALRSQSLQQLHECCGRDRRAAVVALALIAAEIAKELESLARFDSTTRSRRLCASEIIALTIEADAAVRDRSERRLTSTGTVG